MTGFLCSANGIKDEAAWMALADALNINTSLTSLNLLSNSISSNAKLALMSAWGSRPLPQLKLPPQ